MSYYPIYCNSAQCGYSHSKAALGKFSKITTSAPILSKNDTFTQLNACQLLFKTFENSNAMDNHIVQRMQ